MLLIDIFSLTCRTVKNSVTMQSIISTFILDIENSKGPHQRKLSRESLKYISLTFIPFLAMASPW